MMRSLAALALILCAAAAQAQSPYPACRQLERTGQQINGFGTEAVQALRGIYTIHGLAFGGAETPEKCTAALIDALVLQQDLLAAGDGDSFGEVCRDMDDWIDVWRSASNGDAGRLRVAEAILASQGLSLDGPREDPAACERAFLAMQDAGLMEDGGAAADGAGDAFGREALSQWVASAWAPIHGGAAMTLWDHNGSQMAWETGPGAARHVWYWRPRQALTARGVRPGQLLFDGARQGDRMVGTARIFAGNCGVWTYPVEGPITDRDERVTMRGLAPVLDASCRVTGTREDVLVFTFAALQPGAAPAPAPAPAPSAACAVPAPADPPAFGVWNARLGVRRVPAGDTLNVRSGPTTDCPVLWELPADAAGILVEIGGCTGDYIDPVAWDAASLAGRTETLRGRWCHVSWGGRDGWASGSYLQVLG